MTLKQQRQRFEEQKTVYDSALLTFRGADGFDVYNISIPFRQGGKRYLFGRLERRGEWARSWVRLFEETGADEWTVVEGSMIYTLEDPYVTEIGEELVMGGTHVQYQSGKYSTFFGYFFRGTDINDLYYFTTGPDKMKDIRLVALPDGKIGVFSRPRGAGMQEKYGSESMIGFTAIDDLNELTADVIASAPYIEGIFGDGEWGGVNQAYRLDSGRIGVIGHIGYNDRDADGQKIKVYLNMAFVFDPDSRESSKLQVIGSRSCYPPGPAKKPDLIDCVFSAGIEMRKDGKADLYSGVGDCQAGRITIDDPFAGYGRIVSAREQEEDRR